MPLPTRTVSAKILTVLPASAVPVNIGVVTAVILSVLDVPVSLAASRSGTDGVAGAVVSTVTDNADDDADVFPARSVMRAVIECAPLLSALLPGTVKVQSPSPS